MPSTTTIIFFSLAFLGLTFFAGTTLNHLPKNTASTANTTANTTAITAKTIFTATKNNQPQLDFYVMSFCPYGNQMESLLRPVYNLIGKKALIQPHYIFDKITDLTTYCKSRSGDVSQCKTYVESKYFTSEAECQKTISQNLEKCQDVSSYIKSGDGTYYASLHGRIEANQDVREICAWGLADDKTKWWDFVGNVNQNCNAQNADSCWEDQAKKAGLDTGKITECFNQDGFTLIEKEIALTTQYKVSGSPTLILNGANFPPDNAYTQDNTGSLGIGKKVITQDKYRTPDTIKEALCDSFNKAPQECQTILPEPAGSNAAAAGGCN